jgi:hypothetical protein
MQPRELDAQRATRDESLDEILNRIGRRTKLVHESFVAVQNRILDRNKEVSDGVDVGGSDTVPEVPESR